MNVEDLEALTALLRKIQGAEADNALFLDGSVDLVDSDGARHGRLLLNGSNQHELITE